MYKYIKSLKKKKKKKPEKNNSNLFGKKFEANLKKKKTTNEGGNPKIYFSLHLFNPEECPFKMGPHSVNAVVVMAV